MRCLALAQAWQDAGGRAVFAMGEKVTAIESRLAAEKMPIFEISAPVASDADARETAALAKTHGASWVVVDGYRFDRTVSTTQGGAPKRRLPWAGFRNPFGENAHGNFNARA